MAPVTTLDAPVTEAESAPNLSSTSRGRLAFWILFLLAVSLRVVLYLLKWPNTDADESVYNLMSLHITKGSQPIIFMYGNYYLGTLQAYLGAFFFWIMGPSVLAGRMVILLLFMGFLLAFYPLYKRLFSPGFACFALVLVGILNYRWAYALFGVWGGTAEIIFFQALLFLLSYSIITWTHNDARQKTWRFYSLFCLWGVVAGAGLYAHLLIAPAVACSGLLLLVFAFRYMRSWPILLLIAGFALGAFPMIYYNIQAAPGTHTWETFAGQTSWGNAISYWQRFVGFAFMSFPLATSMEPICRLNEPIQNFTGIPELFAGRNDNLMLCATLQGSWTIGWLLLILLSGGLTLTALRRTYRLRLDSMQPLLKQATRFSLILCAILIIYVDVTSTLAGIMPESQSRYLIVLLPVLPSVLWPLWKWLFAPLSEKRFLLRAISVLVLGVVTASFIAGTARIFYQEVPWAQQAYQDRQQILHALQERGITRIQTDYWGCYGLAFESREQIVCRVVQVKDDQLVREFNRYVPYAEMVEQAPTSALLFKTGSPELAWAESHYQQLGYQRVALPGYVLFYP